ncbi:hypothetical protein DER29_2842 [Micromonospora sp. M71_S20]|nr:hypothetical protein DER29_2842 [Micromonospora sp. M71_S20]
MPNERPSTGEFAVVLNDESQRPSWLACRLREAAGGKW